MSDYAMLIRQSEPPSPQPSPARGEGVKRMSSPLMGEEKGEGGKSRSLVGQVSRRRNLTFSLFDEHRTCRMTLR